MTNTNTNTIVTLEMLAQSVREGQTDWAIEFDAFIAWIEENNNESRKEFEEYLGHNFRDEDFDLFFGEFSLEDWVEEDEQEEFLAYLEDYKN